ncbi:hypothetical protein A3850_016660 [Lewinella sp. 4G2]|nr:hypothetical protein A3850_016660 [Lewinella sp. 4G2]
MLVVNWLPAQSAFPVYEYSDHTDEVLTIPEELLRAFADTSGQLELEDILSDSTTPFGLHGDLARVDQDYAAWFRIRLTNTTEREVIKLINYYLFVERGEAYVVENNQVIRTVPVGAAVPVAEKDLYRTDPYVQLVLPPGATRTVYLRASYGESVERCCPFLIQLVNPERQWRRLVERGAAGYFFFGVLLLFCGIGVLAYWLLRARLFLYFAGVMLAFGVYFLMDKSIFSLSFPGGNVWGHSVFEHWAVAAVFLFLALFVVDYVEAFTRLPRGVYVYLGLTALTMAIPLSSVLWFSPTNLSKVMIYENGLYLIWTIYTFTMIGVLAWRGVSQARVLLVGITFLFVGSVLSLLLIVGIIPRFRFSNYLFEASTVIFGGFLFRELFSGFNELRQQNEVIRESGALRSKFFANITHEFRTPLTLMLGPLRQVIDNTEDANDLAMLRTAEVNAERQLELVDQLLDLSRLDAQAMDLQASYDDFAVYFRRLVSAYESLAAQRQITLTLDAPDSPVMLYFDQGKTDRIFYNLLSNALKFTPAGGQVNLALSQDAGQLVVRIRDTGPGIGPETLTNIFDRFFMAGTDRTGKQGTGIGLALVREMTHLHHGEVGVQSKLGEGTTFTVKLPLGNAHLESHEIVATSTVGKPLLEPEYPTTHVGPLRGEASAGDLANLLLVEDNDEIRDFIQQMLTPHYAVTLARDGAEGIRLALADPPDLIISDLMMPKKDGYEVCRALKADLRTSHVPIILLTARTDRTDRITGLEEGADAYLTKPFDVRELLMQASNLIRSRQVLRERFATSITVAPSEIAVSSLDRDFMEKAVAYVEANLDSSTLSVDELAAEMETSRSGLNRKLRSLVDQSSNQFIQSIRLQRAAQLLAAGSVSVKEVAYACGFSSATYFAKQFRERYGVAPSQYVESGEK